MLEQNVNKAQLEAIKHGTGAMLVLAGPGSGKTFTVSQRIKYLIEHHHVKPESILVITFTKAAAAEMQERFVKLNEGRNYPVQFGTFHSIFFQILRHTYRFTAQNIIREGDKYKLLSQIISEMPEEIQSQSQIDDSVDTLQRLLSEISTVKNNGITPQEIKSTTVSQTEFEYIFQLYKQEMNRNKRIDFDDMVLLCRDLLVSRPDTLKIWQERFQYILVDEFQDICPLQYDTAITISGVRLAFPTWKIASVLLARLFKYARCLLVMPILCPFYLSLNGTATAERLLSFQISLSGAYNDRKLLSLQLSLLIIIKF